MHAKAPGFPGFSFEVPGLLVRPIGRLVVSGERELASLRAVGQHGPNLACAVTGGFKDNVAAIGGPGGALVAAHVGGEVDNLLRARFHDVNIVVAGGAAPAKGQELAVG